MTQYLRISSYIRKKPFLTIRLCNSSHLNFLTFEENFILFFISAETEGTTAISGTPATSRMLATAGKTPTERGPSA
jgi:hypothetical protein